jgi:hypothetical protein
MTVALQADLVSLVYAINGASSRNTSGKCYHPVTEVASIYSKIVNKLAINGNSPSTNTTAGSMKANGREPKSCLGQVFNLKLGCFVMCTIAWSIQVQPSLQWKTRHRFCPVSLSLSTTTAIFWIPLNAVDGTSVMWRPLA